MRHVKFVVAAAVALGALWYAAPASALDFVQPAGSPYNTGLLETNSVRTGDVNGDGRDDVFTANADYSASVYLSGPSGTLSPAPGSPITTVPYNLSGTLADLNGDSKLDMVLAQSGNQLSIRLGNGDGSFQPPVSLSVTASAQDIAAADLNGDGKQDLIVAGSNLNNVSILLGNGDGTFVAPVTYPVGPYPNSIAVADFDGDGSLDFATSNGLVQIDGIGAVTVMLNSGSGTFSQAADSPYTGLFQPQGITSGDFNDDGDPDLAVAARSDRYMQVLMGDGDGTFTAKPSVYVNSEWSNSVAAADFNEDGFDDVLVGMSTNLSDPIVQSAPIFLGNSTGDLVASPDGPWVTTSPSYPWTVATGDLNDDGHEDWVSGDQGGRISVFMNEAPSLAVDPTSLNFPNVPVGGVSTPLTATLTNDGIGPVSIPAAAVTITGLNASDFQIDSEDCESQVLDSGDSCEVDVVFAPGAFGGKNAALEVAHDATGSPTTVVLSGFGTANPGIGLDPGSHDFGSRRITVDTSSQTFIVESTGTTPLSIGIGDIQVTGSDASQFSIDGDDCSGTLIQPEDTCEVVVEFAPTTVGAKSASLSISSNAPNAPHTAALTGTGTTFAYPSFDPESLDFGAVLLASGPTSPQTITMEAEGASPLIVETLAIDQVNGNPNDFAIVDDGCLGETLQVGETCQFSVEFDPTAIGERTGFIRYSMPGIQGLLFADGEGIDPSWGVTPGAHDFGTRLTDEGPGVPQVFTLTSMGTTDLETSTVSLAGTAADQFQITNENCSNRTLAPQATCEISVAFAPTTAGEKVADLHIVTEDTPGGPANARVTGSGQDPVPPPDPCDPVAIKKVAYFTPSVKRRSNIPGVRARITTAGPADVRISSKVIYHLKGRQRSTSYKQRQFRVTTDSLNYKVAIPNKLRKSLRPKKQVRFVITYASKSTNPECTKFGEKKTRNLTTRIVWVIPNGG